jgi:hypothetical protein
MYLLLKYFIENKDREFKGNSWGEETSQAVKTKIR